MQSHVFYLILDNVTICSICSSPYLLFQENGHDEIVIKAMGRAINKTVMVVELIKVSANYHFHLVISNTKVILCFFNLL